MGRLVFVVVSAALSLHKSTHNHRVRCSRGVPGNNKARGCKQHARQGSWGERLDVTISNVVCCSERSPHNATVEAANTHTHTHTHRRQATRHAHPVLTCKRMHTRACSSRGRCGRALAGSDRHPSTSQRASASRTTPAHVRGRTQRRQVREQGAMRHATPTTRARAARATVPPRPPACPSRPTRCPHGREPAAPSKAGSRPPRRNRVLASGAWTPASWPPGRSGWCSGVIAQHQT